MMVKLEKGGPIKHDGKRIDMGDDAHEMVINPSEDKSQEKCTEIEKLCEMIGKAMSTMSSKFTTRILEPYAQIQAITSKEYADSIWDIICAEHNEYGYETEQRTADAIYTLLLQGINQDEVKKYAENREAIAIAMIATNMNKLMTTARDIFMPYAEAVGKIIEEGRPWELRCVKTEDGFKFIRRSSKDKNVAETFDL